MRQLKVQECQAVVKSMDKQKLVPFVRDCVPASLLLSLFLECTQLWESLQDTDELQIFIHCTAEDYVCLYDQHSKGKETYANIIYLS